jgi:hypothetical protein
MVKIPGIVPLKKFIGSYPTLFGMTMGLILVVGIIVIVNWFPRVSEAWDRHNRLVQSTLYTGGFFVIVISRLWHLRRRGSFAFWGSAFTFLLLHTLVVSYYATHVHPLVLREWIVLLAAESFVIVFGMDWLTHRLGHLRRHTTDH